jgi:phenylalanine-4-hydroxylase
MGLSARGYSLELDNIQEIEYNKEEREIWKKAFDRLMWVQDNWAESNIRKKFFEELVPGNRLTENEIPQLKQQSQVHLKKSGWRLRPCTGFLTL